MPAGHDQVQSLVLPASGMHFDALICGPESGDLVILLHGFPQFADSWLPIMPHLAEAGYRVLAVDQRGYSRAARPSTVESYAIRNLVADTLASADALGTQRFHLVGHDWGGLVAWQLAADQPGRLLSLTILSTPHPQAFRQTIRRSLDQMNRSRYILLFKMPRGIPEKALLAFRAAALRSAYQGIVSARQVESNVRRLAEDGTLTAALNWYRALRMNGRTGPVDVPTLYAWGDKDVALGEKAAIATSCHVTGAYRFERLRGVSHWLVDERPDTIAALLVEHLGRHRKRGEQDGG